MKQLRLYPKGEPISRIRAIQLIMTFGDLESRSKAAQLVTECENGERCIWLWGKPGAMIEADKN